MTPVMTVRRLIGVMAATIVALSTPSARVSAQSANQSSRIVSSASPAAAAQCVNSRDGLIDFRGSLGMAGGASVMQIFPWSEGATAYAENLERQLGSHTPADASVSPTGTTLADLEKAMAASRRIPAALASASTASLVNGQFSCNGFPPGRYLMLAQVQGGSGVAGDAKALIAYYRADVDTSSIRKRAVVLVTAFRRIASYPPQEP